MKQYKFTTVFIPVFRTLAVLAVLASIVPLHAAAGSGAALTGSKVYLPALFSGAGNPVHRGIATYYYADGRGACSFDASPENMMVAAMNAQEYDNSNVCGSYIHVEGPKGAVTVRIVDLCPECNAGHLDLSQEAFAKIANIVDGRVDIKWQLVSPAISGPIAFHFKEGSNQWWTAVQVRNHRNPVAKFEFKNASGAWVNIARVDYNFFIKSDGMGTGPYTFRVTDVYGNVITNTGIPFVEGGTVNGVGQFPYGP